MKFGRAPTTCKTFIEFPFLAGVSVLASMLEGIIPASTAPVSFSCIRIHVRGSGRPEWTGSGIRTLGVVSFAGDPPDPSSSHSRLGLDWFHFAAARDYPFGAGRASVCRSMVPDRSVPC